jgi:hypothetical protein
MTKEKKVHTRDTPKYTSSSDQECDDNDDVDYSNLFIDALNKKDRLLEKQEDLFYEEHGKIVKVEKSLALKIRKNEILAF